MKTFSTLIVIVIALITACAQAPVAPTVFFATVTQTPTNTPTFTPTETLTFTPTNTPTSKRTETASPTKTSTSDNKGYIVIDDYGWHLVYVYVYDNRPVVEEHQDKAFEGMGDAQFIEVTTEDFDLQLFGPSLVSLPSGLMYVQPKEKTILLMPQVSISGFGEGPEGTFSVLMNGKDKASQVFVKADRFYGYNLRQFRTCGNSMLLFVHEIDQSLQTSNVVTVTKSFEEDRQTEPKEYVTELGTIEVRKNIVFVKENAKEVYVDCYANGAIVVSLVGEANQTWYVFGYMPQRGLITFMVIPPAKQATRTSESPTPIPAR